MRKDMAKQITECVRTGDTKGYRAHRRALKKDVGDDSVSIESMRKWAVKNYGGKEFDERLQPLARFLKSQVNRPWASVHSEMSQILRKDSAIQLHVWQHVEHMVETNTFIGNDGKIYYTSGGGRPSSIEWSRAEVYVHPRTGILRLVPPHPKYRHKEKKSTSIKVDEWTQIHQINGIWYEIKLAAIPADHPTILVEAITKQIDDLTRDRYYYYIGRSEPHYQKAASTRVYGKHAIAVSKMQLNKKELKKRNLTNDMPVIPDLSKAKK